MEAKFFSLEEIKELLVAVKANEISELELKNETQSLKIVGCQPATQLVMQQPQAVPAGNSGVIGFADGATSIGVSAIEADEKVLLGNVVNSPIVGTFYQSPAPDKAPYATVGDKVKKGDVLFIIESMKLMNEVTSEFSGTVTAILAKDGEAVEYGQAVMTIE